MHAFRRAVFSAVTVGFLLIVATPDTRGDPRQTFDFSRHQVSTFTVFNGLPSDSILTVFQDSVGYLWIGTFDGVVRYDGAEFRVYDQTNTAGFSGHSAQAFVESSDDTIWFGTNNEGLVRVRGERFETFTISDGLSSNSVNALAYSDDGRLWVGTNNGLTTVVDDRITPGGAVRFGGVPIGVLLYTERDGLIAAPRTGGIFAHSDTNPVLLSEETITKAAVDSDGTVWFGSQSGSVFTYTGDQLVPVTALASLGSPIRAITTAHGEDGVWIASSDQLFRVRTKDDVRALRGAHSFVDYVIKSVYEDRQGNLWVGTRTGGLVRFVPIPFQNLNGSQGLTDQTVNSVCEGRGEIIWIGTDDGLFAYRDGEWLENELTTILDGVRVKHVQSESGILYVSTISELGLVAYDGTTVHTLGAEEGVVSGVVKKSVIDSNGNLWISTSAGVVVKHPDGETTRYDLKRGFISNEIYDLYEDSSGRVWVSTVDSGVARIDPEGTTLFNRSNGLSGDMVFSVREDEEGRFWIATADGLFLLSSNDTVRRIPFEAGLPYVYLYAAEPHGDRLWCTSVRGLSALDMDALVDAGEGGTSSVEPLTFTISDGLAAPPNALSWPLVHSDGRVFVPTHRGLSIYEPSRISTESKPWRIVINGIVLDGTELPAITDSIVATGEIENLRITFAALELGSPHEIGYQHRLSGYADHWSELGRTGEAIYRRIPPGTYRLTIRAVDPAGVTRGTESRLLIVRPTFTQTLLFRVAVAVAITLVIAFLVHRKVDAARRNRQRLEREVALRTAELEASHRNQIALIARLSHEIRNPLTVLLAGLDAALRRKNGESIGAYVPVFEAMKRNSNRVLYRVGQLLELFRFELNEPVINPSAVALASVLREYEKDFAIVAEERGIRFDVTVDTHGGGAVVIDPHHLETILLNLLANAFSHTPNGGAVTLLARWEDDTCTIEVSDTGGGMEPVKAGAENWYRHLTSGLGVKIVGNVIDAMGGTWEIASSPATGTRVACVLPCIAAPPGRPEEGTPLLDLYTAQMPSRSEPIPRIVQHADSTAPVVLIVEGDDDVAHVLVDELTSLCTVYRTKNGTEAMELLCTGLTPDVIVSDLIAPGLDDRKLFDRLGEDERFQTIPVLFLTATASLEEQINAFDRGAIDYILKPYQPGSLLLRVQNLMRHVDHAVERYKQSIRTRLDSVLEGPDVPTHRPTRPIPEEVQNRFSFTERETRIAVMVLEGLRDKEIAAHLNVAPSTISNTLTRIYRKAGVSGRVELVSTLINSGESHTDYGRPPLTDRR